MMHAMNLFRYVSSHRVIALLAVAFALGNVAVSTTFAAESNTSDFIVAVVESTPITNNDVQRRIARLKKSAAQAGNVPSADLRKQALEQLITERAVIEQAKTSGVEVDRTAVDREELRVAAQEKLTLDGLHRKLVAEGSSAEQLRRDLRERLLIDRLADRYVPSRIQITEDEVTQATKERIANSVDDNPQIELAHILIAVPEKAATSAVDAARLQAQETLARLKSGADFAALAESLSDSPDRRNGGLMGLRPLDRYPTLFADAVKSLQVGQFAPVLRSGAGFHILKVIERRSSNAVTVTETHVRHILLRPSGQLSLVVARARLSDYRRQIESGKATFEGLAREHSQDGSSLQGGDLGWIAPGVFVPEFEEVMNQLAPGQMSDPSVSRFGVHLIQVLGRRQAAIQERELREIVRNTLRESKYKETFDRWAAEVRGQSYIEYRDPPQ